MLNFGLTELRLVSPRDGWPNPDAGPSATGAAIVLEQARVFATPEEAVALCNRLNPGRQPGRLCLISRMGADRVADALPPLLRAVALSGQPVVWICDPMHGNTYQHASGYKTRDFDDVMRELHGFFGACDVADVWPGGVHVELTGENVTECLGGSREVLGAHLEQRYETSCDPRLNARQSLDLAFQVAELLSRR